VIQRAIFLLATIKWRRRRVNGMQPGRKCYFLKSYRNLCNAGPTILKSGENTLKNGTLVTSVLSFCQFHYKTCLKWKHYDLFNTVVRFRRQLVSVSLNSVSANISENCKSIGYSHIAGVDGTAMIMNRRRVFMFNN